jgi:hypothetical protein
VSFRKAKKIEDLRGDPQLSYELGQVIGAVAVASFWMAGHEDREVQRMGARLAAVSGWFFEGEPVGGWTPEET